jgi:outer membrane protein assembly factor BamA
VSEKVILDALQTKKGSKFSRRAISFDLRSLDKLGYFRKDKLLAVPVPQGEEGVLLKIQVIENTPVMGLIIKGNNSVKQERIEEFLTPLVGMPQSSSQIKAAVEKIETIYHDEGFLLASVTELHFDPDGYLTVSIDEGKIGKIEFIGNKKTKNDYLQKILPKSLAKNSTYNEQDIIKFMEGLHKSGFFKDVKREITPMMDDPSKHVITFKVEEQRTKSLSVGTGVGTANGFFGNLSFTEPNFRGRGENITVNMMGGTGVLTALDGDDGGRFARQGDVQLSASYQDPFFLGKDDMGFSLNTSVLRQGSYIVDSAVKRSIGSGFSVSKRIKNHPNLSVQGGLNLSYTEMNSFGKKGREKLEESLRNDKKYSDAKAEKEAEKIREKQLKDGFYLDLTPSLVHNTVNSSGTGWRNTVFGGPSLGVGVGSYGTVGMDIRRYERLTKKGTFFKNAFRTESLLGDPASFRQLKPVGPYGGRGYRQFLDIGVGNVLISNTSEFSIPIPEIPKNPLKDTKIVFFNDLGAAFGNQNLNDLYSRESAIASIGVGLEVNIPMLGPMRVDYGIPLIRPTKKSFFSGRFHINAGSQL